MHSGINKSFGKMGKNGNLEYAPYILPTSDGIMITSEPEKYKECGYYPIIEKPYPQDGYIHDKTASLVNDTIYVDWKSIGEKIPPTPQEIEAERLKANITELELAIAELYEQMNGGAV